MLSVNDADNLTVYEHDIVGNIILETSGNLVTTRTYDLVGNLLTQSVTQDEIEISSLFYVRNELGDVLEEVSVLDGKETKKTYLYDEASQIISEVIEAGHEVITTTYTYDTWGNKNRVVETIDGNITETQYVYNSKQQLVEKRGNDSSIKLKYDTFGNVVEKAYSNGLVEKYSFDDANQLIKVEDNFGKIVTYGYDALGERIFKEEAIPYDYLVTHPESETNGEINFDIDAIFDNA